MASPKSIVLITGGNQGIGFETAAAVAAASAKYHVIIGSRSLAKGEAALADLNGRKLPGSFSLVQLDVTDAKSITSAAQSIEKEFGGVDVLVNNAGIVVMDETSLINELRKTFETNTFGSAVVTEEFLPLMKKRSPARLIYVSSDLGSIGMRGDPNGKYYQLPARAYRMSKAALNMLAVCQHAEFKEFNINVWTFNPGFVVTNLTGDAARAERIARGAGSATTSAQDLLQIIEGKRDADAGKFVHGEAGDHGQNLGGTHPW